MAWVPLVAAGISGVFSAAGARRRQSFEEYMSNTSHQREVEDLRLAGLNPILSATGGSGASTPSGENILGAGVSSALAARELSQTIKNKEQEFKLAKQLTQKASAEAMTASSEAIIRDEQRKWAPKMAEATYDMLIKQMEGAGIANDQAAEILKGLKIEGEIDETKLGEITRYLNRVFGAGGSAQGVKKLLGK